ncbi:MAG: hypothetical protein QOD09_1946 [Bradyrhizobium sp.]|jgi:hypothetical protein|nr:hypothetical protein [Bradyrhizobium sp.]
MKIWINLTAVGLLLAASAPLAAQTSMSGGTAGSAAVGGTSASTVGTGGTSTSPSGTGSSIAAGGSAAAVDGKAQSGTHVNQGNGPVLNSNTRAQAHDGGTFSRSQTRTKVKAGEDVQSTTRTMSHEPGSKPVKSTTSIGR